jgi:outer membrane protein assembly factor BamD (BamD/ComL family)
VIVIIGGLGALAGYYSGISIRKAVEQNQRTLAASMQYQLGVADLDAGRLDLAKQRFEYVIQLDPSFPGVLENMARLTIIMNATATPTVMPTMTPAPTLDLSGVEALLGQAKQLMAAQDWNNAQTTLDALRKQNPSFKTLEVDGLYYRLYRSRGIQKIMQEGKLEAGIFDFALARQFGPLDKEGRDAEEWAMMYLNAARYFGWEWEKAVVALGDIYQYIPGMRDSSNRTVADRYRESLYRYADTLLEKEKWCQAEPIYLQSLNMANDDKVLVNYTKAKNKCAASQPTAEPTVDPNIPTETPTEPVVEPTEAETPTEAPTP